MYWKKYQPKLLEKVKAVSGGVVVAGDGRHDSMGHSAKFGAYTIFCCTVPMIIHFVLIQVRQKAKPLQVMMLSETLTTTKHNITSSNINYK